MLAARYAARSDIGLSRQTNEDSWLARPPVFAVADGMGGARAGEVASRVALETFATGVADLDPRDRGGAGEVLLSAAEEANRRVWELSTEHASTAGMGTTLTALALCSDAARLVHIGDSRAYALRDEVLTQLTDDHSLVAEMVRGGELTVEETATHPLRSVLSRALGTEPEPTFDLLDVDLRAGDTILLCSDGLTGPVADERIAALLAGADPEQVAQALVAEALESGGPDNITVLVIRVEEFTQADRASGAAAAAAATAGTAAAAGAAGAGVGDAEQVGGAARESDEEGAEPIAAGTGDEGPADESAADEDPVAAPGADESPAAARPDVAEDASLTMAMPAVAAAARPAPEAGDTAVSGAATSSETGASPGAAGAAPGGKTRGAAPEKEAAARPRRRWRGRLIAVLVAVVVLAGGVLAAGQLEWVGVADDGVVTVYRGVPWEFAGLRLYSEHDRSPMVYYEQLPAEQQRQVDAHSVGWRGSGEDLLDRLGSAP